MQNHLAGNAARLAAQTTAGTGGRPAGRGLVIESLDSAPEHAFALLTLCAREQADFVGATQGPGRIEA